MKIATNGDGNLFVQNHIRIFLWVLLLGLASACDVLGQPTPTPIYVTATPDFIIVTSIASPTPSPVFAPTIAPQQGEVGTQPTATLAPPTVAVAITTTPTFTPTPTDTPVTPGAVVGPVGGVQTIVTPTACTVAPTGGFRAIYESSADLAAQLGCLIGTGAASNVNSAYQTFQGGAMIWVASLGVTGQSTIFAVYNNGTYQQFADTWQAGIDPDSLGLAAPAGLQEPIRGFGKVWREAAGVRDALSWASSGETGNADAYTLAFERGAMVYLPQDGNTFIFIQGTPGIWSKTPQPY